MAAKILRFRIPTKRPCRRADGTVPEYVADTSSRSRRLDKALTAVAALGNATFPRKVEVFKRVYGEKRRPKDANGSSD